MAKITLRHLEPTDQAFFYKTYNDKTSRDNMEDDRVILKKWFPYIGGKKTSQWYVIEHDNMHVGLFNSFIKDDKLFWGIIIAKKERRKGYARLAIKEYLKIIDKKKVETHIECFEDNPAINLYKELGYKETDEFRMIRKRKFLRMLRTLVEN